MLAAYAFSDDAWSVAKERGLLAINLRQSYGDAAVAMLAKMEHLLHRADAGDWFGEHPAEIDFEGVANDIDVLRVHPYIAELRSLALEVVTAVLLRALGWEDIELRRTFQFRNTKREVDVVGKRGGGSQIYVVECKAAHKTKELDPVDVRKFFTETVPAALKGFTHATVCKAELWTTGLIGEEAQETLAGISLSKRVVPMLRERAGIVSLVPPPLLPCKRLIETLSLHPRNAQDQLRAI